MKLLLDFNLSPRLIGQLLDLFPGSAHLHELGFDGETPDLAIWAFAREKGFAILTADRDFVLIASKMGHPPKIVRFERMNFRTRFAVEIVRRNALRIAAFGESDQAVLILRNV